MQVNGLVRQKESGNKTTTQGREQREKNGQERGPKGQAAVIAK